MGRRFPLESLHLVDELSLLCKSAQVRAVLHEELL